MLYSLTLGTQQGLQTPVGRNGATASPRSAHSTKPRRLPNYFQAQLVVASSVPATSGGRFSALLPLPFNHPAAAVTVSLFFFFFFLKKCFYFFNSPLSQRRIMVFKWCYNHFFARRFAWYRSVLCYFFSLSTETQCPPPRWLCVAPLSCPYFSILSDPLRLDH